MLNKIIVSIIVPTYNRATLIAKTLKSLQDQSNHSYEIIIVDDGSTDNTQEVVKPFLNTFTSYHKKDNAERAAARNFGARLAKGQYVNFFDSDDIALPNHVQTAIEIIDEKKQPQWFHLGYAWATPDQKVFRKVDNFKGDSLNDILIQGNTLSCNGVFVRKDIILDHPFNEDRVLSASEDFELWLRLAARYPLRYSNVITSLVIDHDQRSVRTINGQRLVDRLSLLKRYLDNDPEIRKVYGRRYKLVYKDIDSYISLHLANQPSEKWRSTRYLFKAFFVSPSIIKDKRFYAIIKNLLIKW